MSQHEVSSKPHLQHLILFLYSSLPTPTTWDPDRCTFLSLTGCHSLFSYLWCPKRPWTKVCACEHWNMSCFSLLITCFFLLYYSKSFNTQSLIQVFLATISSIIYSQMCMVAFWREQLRTVKQPGLI